MTNPVIIISPGLFNRAQKLAAKSREISVLSADDAKQKLRNLQHGDFYTNLHLFDLLKRAGSGKDNEGFVLTEIASIRRLLDCIHSSSDKFDSNEIRRIFEYVTVSDAELIELLISYPEIAKKLPPAMLEKFCLRSVEVAKHIMSDNFLLDIIDKIPAARYRIYLKHKASLWLCDKVFKYGLRDVVEEVHVENNHLINKSEYRDIPESEWRAVEALIRTRKRLEKEKLKLEENEQKYLILLNTIKEKYCVLRKKPNDLNFNTSDLENEIKNLDCANEEHKLWKIQFFAQHQMIEKFKSELGLLSEQNAVIQQEITRCKDAIDVRQRAINQTLTRLREISERTQLGRRTLDIFLRNQTTDNDRKQARDNMFELMRLIPRYMTLLDVRHIQAMFALIENEQEFLQVFTYLSGSSKTLSELIKFLVNVRQCAAMPIMKLSIAHRAYINAAYYIYDQGILFKQEHEHGRRFLSNSQDVVIALYSGQAKRFIQHFNLITDAEYRLNLLHARRSNIDNKDILELTKVITDPKERKSYFHDDKRDSRGLTPLAKLRISIDSLINSVPFTAANHEVLLGVLSQNDLRGWIDLARVRRDSEVNYVRQWLENAPPHGEKYNDDVAKIIAHDKRLLSVIRPNNVMRQQDREKSVYLFAADYVQTKIAEFNRWYDWKSKDRFIDYFVTHFINISANIILEEDQFQAVCWYIANDKDLWGRLVNKCVRTPSWLSGVTAEDARRDREKLIAKSQFFKDKYTPPVPVVLPMVAHESLPCNVLQFVEAAVKNPSLTPQLLENVTHPAHAIVLASVAKPKTKLFIAQLFKESTKLADLLIEGVRKENIEQLTDHLVQVLSAMQAQVPPRRLTLEQLITVLPISATMTNEAKKQQLEGMFAAVTAIDEDSVIHLLNALTWARDTSKNTSYFDALFEKVKFAKAFENIDLILKILAFKQGNIAFIRKYKTEWERLLNNREFVARLNYEQLNALLQINLTTVGLTNIGKYNSELVQVSYVSLCHDKEKLSEELMKFWPLYESIYNDKINEIDEDELTLLLSINNPACQDWLATRYRPTPEKMVRQFAKLDRLSVSRHIHLFEKAVTQKFLEATQYKDLAKFFSLSGNTTEYIRTELKTLFKQNYSTSMRFLATEECDQTLVNQNIDLFLPELALPDLTFSESALRKLYLSDDPTVMPFIFGKRNFMTVHHWLSSSETSPTEKQLKFLLSMIANGEGAEILERTTIKTGVRGTVASPTLVICLTDTIKQLFVRFDENRETIIRVFRNPDAQQLFVELDFQDIAKLAAIEDLAIATGVIATFKNKRAFFNFRDEGFINLPLLNNDAFMLAVLNDNDQRQEILIKGKPTEEAQQQLFMLYKRNRPAITQKLLELSKDKELGFDLNLLTAQQLHALYTQHVFDLTAIAHLYSQPSLRQKFLSALSDSEHRQFYFDLLKTADAALVDEFLINCNDFRWFDDAALMQLLTHNMHFARRVLMNERLRDALGITQHHLQYVLGLIIKQPEQVALFFDGWSDKKFISEAFVQAVWHGHVDKIAMFLQTQELQQLFDKEYFSQSILGKQIVLLPWLNTCGKQFENQLRAIFPGITLDKSPSLPEKSSLLSNLVHTAAEIVPGASSQQKMQEALLGPIQKEIKALRKQLDKEKGDKRPLFKKLLAAFYEYRLSNNNTVHEKEREIKSAFFVEMGSKIQMLLSYCLDNEVKASQAVYLILEGQPIDDSFGDAYQMQMLMDPIICPLLNAKNILSITDKYPQQRLFCLTHIHTLLVLAKDPQVLLEVAKKSGFGRTDKEVAEILIRLEPIASDNRLAGLLSNLQIVVNQQVPVSPPTLQQATFKPAAHALQPPHAKAAATFFGQQRATPVTGATQASQAASSPAAASIRMTSDE